PNSPYDVKFGRAGRLYSTGNPCSGGLDGLHVFDTAAVKELSVTGIDLRCAPRLAITADGSALFAAEGDISPNDLRRYDIPTDTPTVADTVPFGSVNVNTVAIRSDGSQVYTSGHLNTFDAQVWTGDLQHQLGAFNVVSTHVAYAAGGDRVFFTTGNTLG